MEVAAFINCFHAVALLQVQTPLPTSHREAAFQLCSCFVQGLPTEWKCSGIIGCSTLPGTTLTRFSSTLLRYMFSTAASTVRSSSSIFLLTYYRYAFVLDLFNNIAAMVAFIKSLLHDKISFVFLSYLLFCILVVFCVYFSNSADDCRSGILTSGADVPT